MSAIATVVAARIGYERRGLDTSEWQFDLKAWRRGVVMPVNVTGREGGRAFHVDRPGERPIETRSLSAPR